MEYKSIKMTLQKEKNSVFAHFKILIQFKTLMKAVTTKYTLVNARDAFRVCTAFRLREVELKLGFVIILKSCCS